MILEQMQAVWNLLKEYLLLSCMTIKKFKSEVSDYDQCLFFFRFLHSPYGFTHKNECKSPAVCKINIPMFQEESIKMKAKCNQENAYLEFWTHVCG